MIKNQIRTVVLLGLLTGLLLGAGQFFGGTQGLLTGLVIAIVMNFGTYWFSDKIVLAMYRGKIAAEKDFPDVYAIVKEVAGSAGMPAPKVYVIPSDSPNAFATGRNEKHAAVAVTQGILRILSKDELKGVIAHEISHIKNRDTLIQAVAATIAGVIGYLAFMARFAAIFGGRGSRDSGRMFELLALSIITPLIALIIQLAISRSREFLADEKGAKLTKNPEALASALEKLESSVKANPLMFGSPSTSSLFIVNPFKAGGITSLLSTHPPTKERASRLRSMQV